MLICLRGPTYTSRLWCLLEVYVHMVVGGSASRMHVIEISKACALPALSPRPASSRNSHSSIVSLFANASSGAFSFRGGLGASTFNARGGLAAVVSSAATVCGSLVHGTDEASGALAIGRATQPEGAAEAAHACPSLRERDSGITHIFGRVVDCRLTVEHFKAQASDYEHGSSPDAESVRRVPSGASYLPGIRLAWTRTRAAAIQPAWSPSPASVPSTAPERVSGARLRPCVARASAVAPSHISSRSAQCADEAMRQTLLGVVELGYGSLEAFGAALEAILARAAARSAVEQECIISRAVQDNRLGALLASSRSCRRSRSFNWSETPRDSRKLNLSSAAEASSGCTLKSSDRSSSNQSLMIGKFRPRLSSSVVTPFAKPAGGGSFSGSRLRRPAAPAVATGDDAMVIASVTSRTIPQSPKV